MKRWIYLILLSMTTIQSMPFDMVKTYLPGPTYRDLRLREGYATAMPSQGLVNMLVIPINFSDASCDTILEGCDQTITNLELAFFGEEGTLPWHSVRTYFQTSSYGQLTIDGMVSDWYTPSVTAVDLSNNRGLLGSQVIQPAIQDFKNTYPDRVQEFDTDDDGYLDAVYFIYSLPFDPEGEQYGEDKDVFWAFVAYQGGNANLVSPTLFHYGWSSYQFMYEDGEYQRSANGKVEWDENNEPIFLPWKDALGHRTVDAHIYIHEVGHLLGLLDYYSYGREEGDWGPTGALDMMDYNLGDHNGFSKMALDWVTPYVATNPTTFTLSPLATSPDILLLPKGQLTTMMDEYILVEFYQPIAVNEKDSQTSYAGRYPKMFSIPGVKIYHLDARIAQLLSTSNGLQFDRYVTSMQPQINGRYQLAHSNSVNRNVTGTNPNFKLVHLLESSGINTFRHGGFATNATLFQTGMTFNSVDHPYLMNDGTRLPWQLTIGAMTIHGVDLTLDLITE